MPLITGIQETIVIPEKVYNIHNFMVDIESQVITISYHIGSIDNGTFRRVSSGQIQLEDNDFLATAVSICDGSKNLYDNSKAVLYAKLMEKLELVGNVT